MDSVKSKIVQSLIPGLSSNPTLVAVLDSIVPHISLSTIIKLLPIIKPFLGEEDSNTAQPLLEALLENDSKKSHQVESHEAEASQDHKSEVSKLYDYLFKKEENNKKEEKPLEDYTPEEIVETLKSKNNGNSDKFNDFVSDHQDDIKMLFKSLINHGENVKRSQGSDKQVNLSSFASQHGDDILTLYSSFLHFGEHSDESDGESPKQQTPIKTPSDSVDQIDSKLKETKINN